MKSSLSENHSAAQRLVVGRSMEQCQLTLEEPAREKAQVPNRNIEGERESDDGVECREEPAELNRSPDSFPYSGSS